MPILSVTRWKCDRCRRIEEYTGDDIGGPGRVSDWKKVQVWKLTSDGGTNGNDLRMVLLCDGCATDLIAWLDPLPIVRQTKEHTR